MFKHRRHAVACCRHFLAAVVVGVAAAVLVACAPVSERKNTGPAAGKTPAVAAIAPTPARGAAPPPTSSQPPLPSGPAGNVGDQPAAEPQAVPAAPPPQPVNPEHFLRMSAKTLSQTLGAPDFLRRDGDIEVWQYRSRNCVTDLFLYPDRQAGDVSIVRHVEIRAYGGVDETFCRREIAARMRAG